MFTGIIEECGTVTGVIEFEDSRRLTFAATVVTSDIAPGDSIAVNGVCLTAVEPSSRGFSADVMQESLNRSSLGDVTIGDRVNLERALRVSDRLGGHVVSGHVDGLARVAGLDQSDHWRVMRLTVPADLLRYVVEKGSICLDGVSLTVSGIGDDWIEVSLIPTTLAETTLGQLAVGDRVNVEVDVLAKYVEKLVGGERR